MLIVVMMGKWSDYIACSVVHNIRLYSVLIYGEEVCCTVAFGNLVGVFSFMWYELLMASVISCPLLSSVYECQRVECAFTSPVRTECGMFVVCCMQCFMRNNNCNTKLTECSSLRRNQRTHLPEPNS